MMQVLFSIILILIGNITPLVKPPPPEGATDLLILHNGAIYTMAADRHRVQALAISDGRIVAAGPNREVLALQDKNTRLIDLGGRMVLPGFTDGHLHPVSGGVGLTECDLTDLLDRQAVLDKIRSYTTAQPGKEWIKGNFLWLPVFDGGNPHKSTLDTIVPDRPAIIRSADGHSAWVNSRALAIAGITRNTPDPVNGRIERDPQSGEPTGTLRESAMNLVSRHIPPNTLAENVEGLRQAVLMANRFGITSIVEASASESTIRAFLELEKQGKLNLRTDISIYTDTEKGPQEAIREVTALRDKYQPMTRHIRIGQAKVFIDGVIEGKTAALFENYLGADHRGLAYLEADTYNELVAGLDAAGMQVHVHACGDRAVSMTLDAFQYARRINGVRDSRHHIVHMQLVDPKDIDRFRQLDVIANFQPLWATPEDTYISDLTIPVLGPERSEWIYPLGAVARSGAVIAHGSDWSVTTMNPFYAIQVALTRRGPDDIEREPWTPQHLVDLYTVLAGYTTGGAYLTFREKDTGSLEPGKLADLIVLDRDLFAIPATEIHRTKVLLTMLGGREVYRHPDFK